MALLDWFRNLFRPKPPTPPPPQPVPGDILAQLLAAHNMERTSRGFAALFLNAKLTAAAQKHAAWMDANRTLSHIGSGGSHFDERVAAEGYSMRGGGENIAMGYASVESVVRGWMNSSGHRANILKADRKEVGFGRSGTYWCAVFATPPGVGENMAHGVFMRIVDLPGGLSG